MDEGEHAAPQQYVKLSVKAVPMESVPLFRARPLKVTGFPCVKTPVTVGAMSLIKLVAAGATTAMLIMSFAAPTELVTV
ncbi:MAG: hypothetical protein A3D65_04770 [Candidatus Lloydbacteria bacterium RIFCSPHIGHO2_02_FULL_50_13]|uniref:Uncharacterized protein n=1 Tax=Candidatus Lloydbacteria bacterium RIFCSPHIGHO2_02_FULL_50_13 TaxID=1798661 RepID=A0A1G2DCH2_9BACT|nr:MAG: hypothetical protein A3D65_04770 [Candidatus Lloydbacteria bacterium RIFCSPHIGHO2_02_FULL_50_13]